MKKKAILIASAGAAAVIAIIILVNVFNYVRFKPLKDVLAGDVISSSDIKVNYSNLQDNKKALKIFKKELEKCHDNNDLEKALAILTAMAENDVNFSDVVVGADGNFDEELNPYIMAWDTFVNWMYVETLRNGQEIPAEKEGVYSERGYNEGKNVTETYYIHGYKLSADNDDNDAEPYILLLYIPSEKFWYRIDQSAKYFDGGNNIVYHKSHGGVMVN